MLRALYTAAAGMTAQQFNMDTISNNLSNSETTGYKRMRPEFQDLIYQQLTKPTVGNASPFPLEVGVGVRPAGSLADFSQGALQTSDNPLDLALAGPGFFTVAGPEGTYYTRDGSFQLDGLGRMVTSDGNYLLDSRGRTITIPDQAQVEIARDGTINYTLPGGQAQTLTQIAVTRFTNPAGLLRVGHNLFQAGAASGPPAPGDAGVMQYRLEASNVQAIDEIVNLITAQRSYELSSKAVQAADDMLGIANNLRR